ncbi:MAG TPA: AAA family ATPase [Burkholderiales bacterium]|nr:AAA family ATPase [Burkholderiales bacterium]
MDPLVAALNDSAAYPHPVTSIEVMETHISWVLLTGDYAYKIKKPVTLDFLDFSSLDARRRYCDEELRLNRRFAPQLYLAVVPITGNPERPQMDGAGKAFEYAVKMRQFGQDGLFDHLVARNALTPQLVERLAACIAAFHERAPAVSADSSFGTPEAVMQPALDNFEQMAPHVPSAHRPALDVLQTWTADTGRRLQPTFAARRRDGFVRECHGDLHLRNIVLIDGEPVPFDCIEFDAGLRWIDVMNEVAFLAMDLIDRRRSDLAFRFINIYLEITGDYEGVTVLRFYLVYRALVRAKIHGLRARQAHADPREAARLDAAAGSYMALAQRLSCSARPVLIAMHGFSGSGKSTIAVALSETLGAIRVRSDVERKRLSGLNAGARNRSAVGGGIYQLQTTERVYRRLCDIAETVLNAGYPAIIDAAFLGRPQRDLVHALAGRLGASLIIIDCDAAPAVLRDRIALRETRGSDPSEATAAVLDHQLAHHDALATDEMAAVIRCDMSGYRDTDIERCVQHVVRRLDSRPAGDETARTPPQHRL